MNTKAGKLKKYCVVVANPGDESGESDQPFNCLAENDEHAKEQALNAYPGQVVNHCGRVVFAKVERP